MDPREMPAYGISEAAFYLDIPDATLRSWVVGRHYPVAGGRRYFKPLIELADKDQKLLSFINLIEAHVLNAIRRDHQVQLPKVRKAMAYLKGKIGSEHPLADRRLETDGLDLFVEEYSRLINISRDGQMALKGMLELHLKRIARDAKGLPVKLYLFSRMPVSEQPSVVVVNPSISFGRPVLEGTGVVTSILAERYKAGESLDALAEDYGRPKEEIEEAIRYEIRAA
jgi:uncharacterized protein (DUF433 family)